MTSEDNQTQPHPVSDRQLLAIDALLTGATHNEAADIAGVHRCTVTGWVNHHIGFITELNQRRHQRNLASADLLHSVIQDALRLLTQAISEGNVKAALSLLSRLDLQTIYKAGSPKTVTPLAVISDLANKKESSVIMNSFVSSNFIDFIEKESQKHSDTTIQANDFKAPSSTDEYKKTSY